jgi:serine protease Do
MKNEELEMRNLKKISISMTAVIALLTLTGCGLLSAPAQFVSTVKANTALDSHIARPKAAVDSNTALLEGDILSDLEGTLSAIYETVNPSVVSIKVVKTTTSYSQMPGLPFSLPQEPQEQTGAGSGFVWDTDGHIVTNNHVIDGADRITVYFSDGSSAEAEVVGADPDSDLAVLQIDPSAAELRPVKVNDTNDLAVGQLAVAIGNPFGLENTMTVGFISALGRSLPVDENAVGSTYTIPNIIQTDAPINPGNSGGVLVNSQGEVIGVTAAIISPVQASVGIGFAVPAENVLQVVPELIANGSYEHAWLGLSGYSLFADVADAMDLPSDTKGVVVATVIEGGPSEQYGLVAGEDAITVDGVNYTIGGDVITALNGEPVNTFEDLVALLSTHSAGEKVTITLLRNGKEMTVPLTLGTRPATQEQVQMPMNQEQTPVQLGIIGRIVDEDVITAMGLDANQEGVLVTQVYRGSVADKAGLQGGNQEVTSNGQSFLVGGDIITAWDGHAITSVPDLRTQVSQTESGDTVNLTVLRDGETMTLTLEF